MKRIIDQHLLSWKNSPHRKPLLLRGARQVGKTHAARQLGKSFKHFVEINFEAEKHLHALFHGNLDPERIMRDITLITGKQIIPGTTLLFFDEIQGVPEALISLRYFYEKLPELHIIAAGSLLDFATQEVGIPVGRVSSLYMYPLSFFEFLCACGHTLLAQELLTNTKNSPLSEPVHQKLLQLVGEYLAIGGMPEAVMLWQKTRDPKPCFEVHHALIDTYRQDFAKYAKKFQIKYLEILFNAIPRQLGTKFKHSAIEGDYRKRELAPCIDLLSTAGLIHSVSRTAGNGLPLGAEADPNDSKIVFLDVALCQSMLGLDISAWLVNPHQEFVNKGALVEAFVGQELLAYAPPSGRANLFYWRRNVPGSEAEIDYLVQDTTHVIPVEVKSGAGTTLKSMHMFLEGHPQSPYGLKLSTNNYSVHNTIRNYPLYAIAAVVMAMRAEDKKVYEAMVE